MGQTHSAVERQPVGGLVLILEKKSRNRAPQDLPLAKGSGSIAGICQPEELVVVRCECLNACMGIVLAPVHSHRNDSTQIIGTAIVFWNHRRVGQPAEVVRAVEVIERRDRPKNPIRTGMQPGEVDKIVALTLHVANAG